MSAALIPNAEAGSYKPGDGTKYIVLLASYMMKKQVTASSTFSNYSSEDLYYFQLWSAAGALEHNLMPAMRDSDSAVGLYDTVTRKFYAASKNTLTGYAKSAVTGTPVKWTGAGDGVTMSSGANWEGGVPPGEGDDLDFTIAVPNAAINADISATFGKLWLGDGDGPVFTGSLSVTSVNDGTKVRGAVTIVAYYDWNGTGANWSDVGAWTFNGASVTWADGVNATFSTANATAALTADATAASLSFTQPATISGSSTLTVPTVDVASGVSATITAPTDGTLEKTGAGALTLGSSRTAATTLSEGTLKMSPGATVATLTLGTGDSAKPVTFDYGGQTLSGLPSLVTGSDITLTNGTFTASGAVNVRNNLGYDNIPAVLTIAKDATFQKLGANNHLAIVNENGQTTLNVAGGSFVSAYSTYFQHSADTGTMYVNFTDGADVSLDYSLFALCYGSVGTSPSLYMRVVDSTLRMGLAGSSGDFKFGNHATVPVEPTGVFAATNSVIYVGGNVYIGRQGADEKTSGSYTADIESCVVTCKTFAVYWDRPLNHARFNDTAFTFGNTGSIVANTDDAKWITVDADGLVIDTQNFACSLNANIGGTGAIAKVGSGTLTVARSQTASAALNANEGTLAINDGLSIARPIAVASGATLKFLGEASLTSLALTAGSTNDIATVSPITVATSATLPASGTVALTYNGGAFPVGIYRLFSYSGAAAADGEKFAPETGGETAAWSVVNGALTLTVGNPPNTWIGGATGNLSDAANWSAGSVPGRGDTAALGAGSAATFTVGASFSPDVIIIPEGSADVTFSGENAITGLAAVTNLSESVCSFEVPVAFANGINVHQTGYLYFSGNGNGDTWEHAGGSVKFPGGVTGSSFAEGTSRLINGVYTVSAAEGWAANDNTTGVEVWSLRSDTGASSLTIAGTSRETPLTDLSMLLVGTGSAFTTGVVRTSNRVTYRMYGDFVVTDELEVTIPTSSGLYIAQRYSDGDYKFGKFTLGDAGTAGNFWICNYNNNSTEKHLYIGAGGMGFASDAQPATAYILGYRASDVIWLYPWLSDYTISGKDGESTRDVVVFKPSHFVTDDENGVARTVTINGIMDVRNTVYVEGHGTMQVNSDGFTNGSTVGDVFVNDHATLSFAPGADLSSGAITVGADATLAVSGSGTVTVGGGLSMTNGATLAFNFTDKRIAPTLAVASGGTQFIASAEGATVNVKITGVRPRGGQYVLTTFGGFDVEGVEVALSADAPEWAAGRLSVNADGNLVLSVKRTGMMMIIR